MTEETREHGEGRKRGEGGELAALELEALSKACARATIESVLRATHLGRMANGGARPGEGRAPASLEDFEACARAALRVVRGETRGVLPARSRATPWRIANLVGSAMQDAKILAFARVQLTVMVGRGVLTERDRERASEALGLALDLCKEVALAGAKWARDRMSDARGIEIEARAALERDRDRESDPARREVRSVEARLETVGGERRMVLIFDGLELEVGEAGGALGDQLEREIFGFANRAALASGFELAGGGESE